MIGSLIDMGHVIGQMELLWFWFARSRFYPNTTLISVIRWVFQCVCTERCWNMWIPGFGRDELPPFKKQATTETHKQVSKRKMYVTVSCLKHGAFLPLLMLAILSPNVMLFKNESVVQFQSFNWPCGHCI